MSIAHISEKTGDNSSNPPWDLEPALLVPASGGSKPVLSLICSFLTETDELGIRSGLPSDLANMAKRTAKAVSPIANAGNTPRPEYGPSMRILTQAHRKRLIEVELEKIKKTILRDPAASKLVCDIDRIEKQYPQACFQYSGMCLRNYTSLLFTSALFSATLDEGDKVYERAAFLRLPEPDGAKTVQAFLKMNPPDENRCYDLQPHIRKELVSTSPVLFSNPHDPGECTWLYYRGNKNCMIRKSDEFFKMVFDRYGLVPDLDKRKAYIAQLSDLHLSLQRCAAEYLSVMRSEDSSEASGIVFQFGLSEDIVHEVCYTSQEFGIPNPNFDSFSEAIREQCEGSYPAGASKKEIEAIEDDRLRLQGRLLAQSTMVPDHNIQTLVHGYGRFFCQEIGSETRKYDMDDRKSSETASAAAAKSTWDMAACQKLARQADEAESSPKCKKLIAKKEEILAKAKRVFAKAIKESPARSPDAEFLCRFF